jgi:hypothetical protein
VAICLPAGVAALIHATTGMGKVIVDPQFSQIDKYTYQSPDYDSAVDRIEIKAKSGAGNVSVITDCSLETASALINLAGAISAPGRNHREPEI